MTATTAITPFNFNSHDVRVVVQNGEPWFVATDVAESLGYKSPKDAASYLDDDEKGSATIRTPGGDQKLTVINESGLYALVLRSRKPEARKFAKWVTSEVLPSIRKTGQYTLPSTITPAQAQHLKELVQLVVESGKQNYGETWSRLQRKFGVNSYLELPADQFEAAAAYLKTKMDDSSIAVLVQKHLNVPSYDLLLRAKSAMEAANRLASNVQESVFNQLMEGHESFAVDRWLLSFSLGKDGFTPSTQAIERSAFVSTAKSLSSHLNSNPCWTNEELASIAAACNQKLAQRFNKPAKLMA